LIDPFWWWADVDIVATDGTTVNQYAELYWNDTEITDWDNSVFADFDGYSYTSGSDTYYKGANTFLVEERRIVDTAGNPFGIVYYSFKDIARG
jgi:hypothetical protein